ncbi:MAG: hypothetical protein J7L61_01125, partial [Thermoplasmata archaeon]|nr:hypothetical protein [Thermoplasmata archaeon]
MADDGDRVSRGFSDPVAVLESRGMFHVDLGLGRMEALVDRLGLSREALFHLAGTNGKGSTAAMLAAFTMGRAG